MLWVGYDYITKFTVLMPGLAVSYIILDVVNRVAFNNS